MAKAPFRNLLTVTADATSPTSATYQVTTGVAGFAAFDELTFVATITGPASGALDVLIEHSPDGVAWYEYAHFTQVAAGTTKTFVFSPVESGAIVLVGKNNASGSTLTTTMTIDAGNGSSGQWFDQLRVRYVGGAGTNAGAAQIIGVICYEGSSS